MIADVKILGFARPFEKQYGEKTVKLRFVNIGYESQSTEGLNVASVCCSCRSLEYLGLSVGDTVKAYISFRDHKIDKVEFISDI